MAEPLTRRERYYAAMAGSGDAPPYPITNEEKYLQEIIDSGGGGGSGGESTIAWKPSVNSNGDISWTRTSSTSRPATQNIKGSKGDIGETGRGIQTITLTSANHLIFTYTDGTTVDSGVVQTAKGDTGADGFSPSAEVARNAADDGVVITVTDKSGVTKANVYDGASANNVNYATGVTNKPKINNIEVSGEKSLNDYGIDIPINVSELTNDSGFITADDIPTIDTALSSTSEKAVQNKAVTTEIRAMQEVQNSMVTDINVNTQALTVLNGDVSTAGSVKKQIADAISGIDNKINQIVTVLPDVEDARNDVIYLMLDTSVTDETVYLMYMLVENADGSKELANTGSTKTDLSGYYTITEVDTIADSKQDTVTGAASTIVNMDLSAAKVMVTNSSGKAATSPVTAAELENLQGITDNVQTQLDGKQAALSYDTVPTADSDNVMKSKDLKTAFDSKQDTLTFDDEPTSGSLRPVTSGGIFDALNDKMDVVTVETSPHEDSTNLVTSGGVYAALANVSVDVATASTTGIVKPDNDSIVVDTDGTISANLPTTATEQTAGIVKPDGTTITVDADGVISGANTLEAGDGIDISNNVISAETLIFKGTTAEWDALTTAEQEAYAVKIITDDGDTGAVVDSVESGNFNAVTSNAVYDFVNKVRAYSRSEYSSGGGVRSYDFTIPISNSSVGGIGVVSAVGNANVALRWIGLVTVRQYGTGYKYVDIEKIASNNMEVAVKMTGTSADPVITVTTTDMMYGNISLNIYS